MASSGRLVLVGNGGHAGVVLGIVSSLGLGLAGIIARDEADLGGLVHLGDDEAYAALLADGTAAGFVFGIGSIDRPTVLRRARVFDRLAAAGGRIPVLIHPKASVSEATAIGAGTVICRGAIIGEGVTLGRNVIVNTGAIIDHDCVVGDHTHVGPGVVISGGTRIGARSHVGVGARLVQALTLGEEVVVGAGGVVIADVGPGATVVGVPARPV